MSNARLLFFAAILFPVVLATSSRSESDPNKKLKELSRLGGEAAGRAVDGQPLRPGEPEPVAVKAAAEDASAAALPRGEFVAAKTERNVPVAEQEAIAVIVRLAQEQVRAQHSADGIARRDAHAKHHGCVRASFGVLDKDTLPENLRRGVFQPGARYPAIIRFSNGSGSVKPDGKGDGRGMAVKLMGVPGPKLHPSERGTQDFLMINHPAFFVRGAADYVDFMSAAAGGGLPVGFFFNGWPWNWRMKELWVVLAIARQSPSDMLDLRYFSMVPYRLGPDRNMKYSARPCVERKKGYPTKSDHFLRENLKTALGDGAGCFDFMVQLQAPGMSLGDSVVVWDEKASPFLPVAKILIEPQSFDSPEQMAACENLSYTPWHSVPEHEPLGPINAVRLAVYDAVSELRHALNGAPRAEPVP